ncbi:MAG TPA: lipoyl(octanoyl) transferase LipB [Chitinophagaceae bacterium]|nr:lipoyl(octanoyl) transferase LipB [Chitinophagaceae bacterium]
MSSDKTVFFRDLGPMGYQEAWDYQESLLRKNVKAKAENNPQKTVHHLLFCEHPPVFTLGKSGHPENLLIDEKVLREKGIAFFNTNRGGDITYHGPGQIVGYPILDLEKFFTDIGRYLRSLEEIIILTLDDYGIRAGRSPGETGVWIDPEIKPRARKICAMGVRCSRWITMHGFALNVTTDLNYFNYIIPCGITDKQVTSIEKELGREVPMEEVKEKLKKYFQQVFSAQLLPATHLSTESAM